MYYFIYILKCKIGLHTYFTDLLFWEEIVQFSFGIWTALMQDNIVKVNTYNILDSVSRKYF